MAKRSEWDFAVKAVESEDQQPVVIPGRVSKPKAVQASSSEVICNSCSKPVSKWAVLCPLCSGSVHGRSSQVPLGAIVACGVVAAIAWFAIDFMVGASPTNAQLKELDRQLEQSKKMLDESERLLN